MPLSAGVYGGKWFKYTFCTRRKSDCRTFGRGFDSPRLHQLKSNPNPLFIGEVFGFVVYLGKFSVFFSLLVGGQEAVGKILF